MRNATFLRKMLWLLCIPLLTLSCEDKMEEHYKVPDWVADNAWEVLKSGEHGNYSIFLQGVEIAGYKQMLEGKSILTIMAPEDDAFAVYLKNKGYATIYDMPVDEVKKLIGFHLLYYSYPKESLVNFRPTGAMESDAEKNVGAGLYYKHRTKSSDAPTTVTSSNRTLTIYHFERFLPVFSYRYFQSLGINAKQNYETFYPNSTWTGENGFNVSDASVKEYQVIANNGYIYVVDRVLEPLETIYTELKSKSDYSTFYQMYDAFSTYVYDETTTKEYAAAYGVDTLYLHQFGDILPNIASEWPTSSRFAFTSLTRTAYTIFAPSNNALNGFYESFWQPGGYTSLADVDPVISNYFLRQFVWKGALLFPEEVQKGLADGETVIQIDPSTLHEKIMCVNGALYCMDQIFTPYVFTSVLQPLFQQKDARSFMYTLNNISSYTTKDVNYIMLIPVEKQFSGSSIRTSYVTNTLEKDTEEGYVALSSTEREAITKAHIASIPSSQAITLPENGTRVLTPQASSWNYWYVKDGKITCSAIFNQQLNPEFTGNVFATFTKAGEGFNGTSYWFDGDQIFSTESGNLARSLAICADKRFVYYNFVQLLKQADIVEGEVLMNIFGKGRFVAFIPTNDAIQTALTADRIPGITGGSFDASGNFSGTVDKETLKNYLNSYFITADKNSITAYPYPGSSFNSGDYNTESLAADGMTPIKLTYTDGGTSLSVQREGGSAVTVDATNYFNFPFAFDDGGFHLISDVL